MTTAKTQELIEGIKEYYKINSLNELTEEHWEEISGWEEEWRNRLTEEFMDMYADKLDWEFIGKYQKLSEPFMEKHSDKTGWQTISKYQNLSENFIEKHIDKINIRFLMKNKKISENLKKSTVEKKELWKKFTEGSLNEATVNKYIDFFRKLNNENWEKYIAKNKNNISEKFLDENFNKINKGSLYIILRTKKLSSDFLDKHIDRFNNYHLEYISQYQELNDEFIDKHSDKLDWEFLSGFQNLSKEIILKYSDKLNIKNFLENKKIPIETKIDPNILKILIEKYDDLMKSIPVYNHFAVDNLNAEYGKILWKIDFKDFDNLIKYNDIGLFDFLKDKNEFSEFNTTLARYIYEAKDSWSNFLKKNKNDILTKVNKIRNIFKEFAAKTDNYWDLTFFNRALEYIDTEIILNMEKESANIKIPDKENIDKVLKNYTDTNILIKIITDNPDTLEYILSKYPEKSINILEENFDKFNPILKNISKEGIKFLEKAYKEHPVYKGRIPKEIREIISDVKKNDKIQKNKIKENIDIE